MIKWIRKSATHEAVSPAATIVCRGGGHKRKKGPQRRNVKNSNQKLKVLLGTLNPILSIPCKILDFVCHEKLLKTVGLWDFVHLKFDQNIHQGLIAKFVAFYNSQSHCSYVDGQRINISGAHLGRTLKLLKKKDIKIIDEDKKLLEKDESVKFVDELLSTFFLLEKEDVTDKVENLDWRGLLWFMIEKKSIAMPLLCDCVFASHL